MNEPIGDLRGFAEQLAKALVDEPEQVSVSQAGSEQSPVLELTVAPGDLGRVIGKSGRTARALRNLLSVAGMKANKHVTLEILE